MPTTRHHRRSAARLPRSARALGALLPLLFAASGLAGAQGRLQTGPPSASAAAPATQAPTGSGSTVGDLPFQVAAPAPPWIRPGLRLTFYHASSVTPHGDWDYTVDENGEWVDKQGTRYNRERAIGTGSHGLLEVNVAGMDEKQVSAQMLFYLFDGMNLAEPTRNLELGFAAPAATCGDLWMHPQALEELLLNGHAGLNILRVSKTIENATYDGVMIHCAIETGKSVWIYDRASGVLLYSSHLGKQPPTYSNTGAQTSKGGATATFTVFKGSRYPEIPWKDAPAPDWLAGITQLEYQGYFAVRQQGIPDTPLPFGVSIWVKERGADWLLLDGQVRSTTPGSDLPGIGGRASGNRQLCGFWIPVQGLKALTGGQELDRDPLTRVVTRVSRLDAQSVTITQSSPRQQLDFTYRTSDGLLVKAVIIDYLGFPPGMANVREIDLTGAR